VDVRYLYIGVWMSDRQKPLLAIHSNVRFASDLLASPKTQWQAALENDLPLRNYFAGLRFVSSHLEDELQAELNHARADAGAGNETRSGRSNIGQLS